MLRFAAGDERRLAALVDRRQRQPRRRVRRRLAACARDGSAARAPTTPIWVWNPIAAYAGSTPLRELFPGARRVDWLAVDGYNWGATRSWGWQSYADVFAPTLRELRALAPGRPAMIAETGSAPDRRKAGWVTDTLRSARADGVDAVVWFEYAKETDWRLSESRTRGRRRSRRTHGPRLAPGRRPRRHRASRRLGRVDRAAACHGGRSGSPAMSAVALTPVDLVVVAGMSRSRSAGEHRPDAVRVGGPFGGLRGRGHDTGRGR